MQSLPKIVRERLRATASIVDRPNVEHPDADVLNAFADRSLSDGERATIFGHLARCHDCRDIVALALPEIEAAQFATRPASGGWLAWPALRWGVVAAGIVVVASIGALQYQRHARSSDMVAKDLYQPSISSGSQAPAQAPATTAPISEHKEKALSDKDATALPSRDNAPTASAKTVPNGLTSESRRRRNSPLPMAHATGAKVAAPVTAPALASGRPAGAADTLAQNQMLQSSTHLFDEGNSHEIVRAKDATPAVGDAVANVPVNGRSFTALISVAPGTSPGWTINASGGLQRSFDQGNTWQDVNVAANLVPSAAREYAVDVSAAQPTVARESAAKAKESDKKMAAEAPVSAATPVSAPAVSTPILPAPIFRAVAATGADVWAGGSSGALYHSLDAGDHWAQVLPAAADASLTGDIDGLEFSDTLHGKVTTSTDETWITADGGQTWQKQ